MRTRSYIVVLVGLICGVVLFNFAVYNSYGMKMAISEIEQFSFFRNVSSKFLRSDEFRPVISPQSTCFGRDVEMVICVPISRNAQERRQAIRLTWGSYRLANNASHRVAGEQPGRIIVVFFLGSAPVSFPDGEQERLEEEARLYGDILQDTYIDSYKNLSLKSISILNWVSKKCPNARYVAKIDDDMYVNVPLLVAELQIMSQTLSAKTPQNSANLTLERRVPPFMMGALIENAKPLRDGNSKWYTPEEAYKDSMYPKYISGTAYAMTGEAAVQIYRASLRVPLFWLEDIYISGLCAKIANVALIGSGRFSYNKLNATGCTFRKMICAHRYTIDQMKRIHTELSDPSLKC